MTNKCINIPEELKARLDNLKIHIRETYGDVIDRYTKGQAIIELKPEETTSGTQIENTIAER